MIVTVGEVSLNLVGSFHAQGLGIDRIQGAAVVGVLVEKKHRRSFDRDGEKILQLERERRSISAL
jgi:hypothetical protein